MRLRLSFTIFLCASVITGCATRSVVRKPYAEVCRGMNRMAERINRSAEPSYPSVSYDLESNKHGKLLLGIPSATNELTQMRGYPHARIIDDPSCAGLVLRVEEHAPGSIVSTYTSVRSKPASAERTEVVVLSKKTGLYFDSRVRKLEKQRMKELLQILASADP